MRSRCAVMNEHKILIFSSHFWVHPRRRIASMWIFQHFISDINQAFNNSGKNNFEISHEKTKILKRECQFFYNRIKILLKCIFNFEDDKESFFR